MSYIRQNDGVDPPKTTTEGVGMPWITDCFLRDRFLGKCALNGNLQVGTGVK